MTSPSPIAADIRSRYGLPLGVDLVCIGLLIVGFVTMYGTTYIDLARTVWSTDEQGHGPIIFGVSAWLFYSHVGAWSKLPAMPSAKAGTLVLFLGLTFFVLGRSQSFLGLEVFSQLLVIAGLILLFSGVSGLRLVWFPLFFLLFMTPFPEALVAAVTGPLKSAVSVVAAEVLFLFGYPVSRVGVILNVGQYQLLVADACAGLNSMFTLEALGLLYLNLMKYTSIARNIVLSILVIPIAFVANVIRVIILVLVTYHMGDAAGQGFVHGFAGMVLFVVGLIFVLFTDYLLGFVFINKTGKGVKA